LLQKGTLRTKVKPPKVDRKKKMNFVSEQTTSDDSEDDNVLLNYVTSVNKVLVKPFVVTLQMNEVNVQMELDLGSSVSLMPCVLFKKYFGKRCLPYLKSAEVRLSSFTGESLNVQGYFPVTVVYDGQSHHLKLYIVDGGNSALLGCEWLENIKFNWQSIGAVHSLQPTMLTLDEVKV